MMTKTKVCAVALVVATFAMSTYASDRVAVYGKIDRVVLEPSSESPTAIQVWGVFSVAQRNNPNDYQPAARGYLYYSLGNKPDLARREWADLKTIAGTGQVVAFGLRWDGVPQLRQANEPPARPDPYTVNAGLTKIHGRTEYAPIRALIEFGR